MIKIQNLSRSFGRFQAVNDLSFEVGEGELFGFIGPNGAGKTTTIRILATLLLPSSGRVEVMGLDVTERPREVRDVLGFMPDLWGVYAGVTVREYLDFFANAYGLSRRDRPGAIGAVMELTDLEDLADKPAEALSKGMKQRLCLAKTLIHDPRLLILDEPANGLDPRARIELRALLRELSTMGKTILISSHILTELSDMVTSVGIVERGQLVMSGSLESILERLEQAAHSAEAEGQGPEGSGKSNGQRGARFVLRTKPEQVEQAVELLLTVAGVSRAAPLEEREVAIALSGGEDQVAALVRALVAGGVDVHGLREEKTDLETLFMAVTKGAVQ